MALEAYLTTAGLAVLNKVLASKGALKFVKAELGSGVVTGESACRARTSLASKICDASFIGAELEGGQAKIKVQYRNSGLATGFFVNEIGLYVQDPTSSANVLYCYATFGDTPDWIAPASSADYVREYDVVTIVSAVSSVTVNVSPSALVTMEQRTVDMEALTDMINMILTEFDQALRDHEDRITTAETQLAALAGS